MAPKFNLTRLPFTLVAGLATVPHGENYDLFTLEVVERHVSTLAKLHDPLAKFWQHIFDRAADLGMPAELLYAVPDRFHHTLRSFTAFRCEKGVEAGHVLKR